MTIARHFGIQSELGLMPTGIIMTRYNRLNVRKMLASPMSNSGEYGVLRKSSRSSANFRIQNRNNVHAIYAIRKNITPNATNQLARTPFLIDNFATNDFPDCHESDRNIISRSSNIGTYISRRVDDTSWNLSYKSRTNEASMGYQRRKITQIPKKTVRSKFSKSTNRHKPMLTLLIAAHNEELVLAKTLNSAIAAGMNPEHIYVVDDNSSDSTSKIAKSIVPAKNVIKVQRSGKGLALTKASKKFNLTKKYRWIHIADADGVFAPDYFNVFRRELRVKNVAATGYVRSLPGRRISEYRIFEYTVGMEVHRRLQILLGVVPVIPGPTSCFRADIFEMVNFDNGSLTEDFDVTMQIHRKKLGKIQFIPGAVAYTQDPRALKDYIKQITRWNRGGLQSMVRYRIGRKLSPIDAYLSYQILQNLLFFASYLIWVPYLTITRHSGAVIAAAFITDVTITYVITLLTAIRTKRWDVISAFPFVYIIRWVSLAVFLKAFTEVIILGRFRSSSGTWENDGTRRYVMATETVN